jgi:hypothetical protein
MSDGQKDIGLDLTQWVKVERVPKAGILAGVVGKDRVFVWRNGDGLGLRRIMPSSQRSVERRHCRRRDHPLSVASCMLRPCDR